MNKLFHILDDYCLITKRSIGQFNGQLCQWLTDGKTLTILVAKLFIAFAFMVLIVKINEATIIVIFRIVL